MYLLLIPWLRRCPSTFMYPFLPPLYTHSFRIPGKFGGFTTVSLSVIRTPTLFTYVRNERNGETKVMSFTPSSPRLYRCVWTSNSLVDKMFLQVNTLRLTEYMLTISPLSIVILFWEQSFLRLSFPRLFRPHLNIRSRPFFFGKVDKKKNNFNSRIWISLSSTIYVSTSDMLKKLQSHKNFKKCCFTIPSSFRTWGWEEGVSGSTCVRKWCHRQSLEVEVDPKEPLTVETSVIFRETSGRATECGY